MFILRIEHEVPDYDRWKIAFDNDPVGRKKAGVLRYSIYRSADEPNYVMIDLEFDSQSKAQTLLNALQTLWSKVAGEVMVNPKAIIVERIETKQY